MGASAVLSVLTTLNGWIYTKAGHLWSALGVAARDTSGSVALIGAAAMPVLVGGMGLGAEVGYWYLTQRKLQHAADVAAYAAAHRLVENAEQATLEQVAAHVASGTGFSDVIGDLVLHHPPVSGPNIGDRKMVEVVITAEHPRLFSAIFLSDPVEMQGRAVAKIDIPELCVLALSTTASNALHVQGSADLNFENCSIASNSESTSSLRTQGGSSVTADCAFGAGGYQTSGPATISTTVCTEVEINHEPFPDPYRNLAFPESAAACVSGNLSNTSATTSGTLPNGAAYERFCSLTISGDVTFSPGVYIVDGNFTANGSGSISGTGVTLAVAGEVSVTGGVALNLTAPTSGPYSGLLFFGDRDTTAESATITGRADTSYTGAIYFPTGNLTFTGSSAASNGCTQIIANTIHFTGSSEVGAVCDGAGTKILAGPGGSKSLVE